MNVLYHPIDALWELYFRSISYRKLVDNDLKKALELRAFRKLNLYPDLDHPKTINEKIMWLELNTDTALWSEYADKYKVRLHIEKLGFGDYLPRLFGVWEHIDEINYNSLPEKFVLKCTHDCMSTMLVHKKNMNRDKIKKYYTKKLNRQFGYSTCEPHYLKIKPLVIAEEWLDNSHKEISSSMIDYKVWCFDGKPFYIMTIHNRNKGTMKLNLFDTSWNLRNDFLRFTNHYRDGTGMVPKPTSINEMLEIAKCLAEGFPQIRIDFYDVEGKPYIGEMTFTSGAGCMTYFTDESQRKLGQEITLPQ